MIELQHVQNIWNCLHFGGRYLGNAILDTNIKAPHSDVDDASKKYVGLRIVLKLDKQN